TLLWHHRLDHPSLPRLRGMHSLVFPGLYLPSRPRLPRPAYVASRGGSVPLSLLLVSPDDSSPADSPHGHGRERYFLLVVDDYTRYTTVFPLRSKDHVPDVLMPWIRKVRLQLHERFCQDLPVLRLHSDRDDSPQQNGIAERRIGLVMEVARTSMIHAAAPHFLWPFAVRYVAHQLNLWPRVSLPETSSTLRWTGKVGDASVFQFYHPTSRRVILSEDVTCDESVLFY
ncbi:unnamed protein product, partial [Closterium sp. NIES-53]